MIRPLALRSHRVLAWALVGGVATQLAMTTFGIFVVAGSRGYLLHTTFGRLLAVLPLLVLATAIAAGVDRRSLVASLVLAGLVGVQIGLVVLAHHGVTVAMALHPVNGGAILATAGYLAGRADDRVEERGGRGAEAPAPVAGATPALS